MFKTEDIIGDVIFISFKETNRYLDVGIKQSQHFLVKGFDNMGIWVAHPGIILRPSEDAEGKPIPEDKIETEIIDGNFLITWDNVKTIMHYPGREGFDFPSEFDRHIGFTPKKEK